MVATGHNLDDEAAVLLGNTLRWDVDYLARQLPVLPAAAAFPKKVKPLVRLTERETAAWCITRGIDYQVEECPMAAGNRHLGYKETLNELEARSPGAKASFYLDVPRATWRPCSPRCGVRSPKPSRPALAAARRPRGPTPRLRTSCAPSAASSSGRRPTSRCPSRCS